MTIFKGSSKYNTASQKLKDSRDQQIDYLNENYVKPNTGFKGIYKAFSGAQGAAASLAVNAAEASAGNPMDATQAVGDVTQIAQSIAAPIIEARKGREAIAKVKSDSERELGIIDANKKRSIASKIADSQNYATGGKVTGPGTAKSDDVPAKMPEGAFVVPAEKAQTAIRLGQQYLGWKSDQKSTLLMGENDVNLSNGEVVFSPEEADALNRVGFNIDKLAPPYETIGGSKYVRDKDGNLVAATEANTMEAVARSRKARLDGNYYSGGYIKLGDMKIKNEDAITYGAGAAQILAGIGTAMSKDKGMPDFKATDLSMLDKSSSGYSKLADKIRNSGSALVQRLKSAARRSANNTFTSEQRALEEKSGGNSTAYLKALGKSGRNRNAAILASEAEAAKLALDTEGKAVGLEAKGISDKAQMDATKAQIKSAENRYSHDKKANYNLTYDTAKGQTAAELISAGMGNITGYSSAKKQAEIRKEREDNSRITVGDVKGDNKYESAEDVQIAVSDLSTQSKTFEEFQSKLNKNPELKKKLTKEELESIKNSFKPLSDNI